MVESKCIIKFGGGVSSARNKGIELAKGEFLCFIDSDDYIHPQMLEVLYNEITRNDCDIAICNRKKVNFINELKPEKLKFESNILCSVQELSGNNKFKISSVGRLYKKDTVNIHRFAVNASRYEDVAFNIELLVFNNLKVVFVNQELYFIFNNQSSLTHTTTNDCQLPACEQLFHLYKNGENIIHIDYLLEYLVKSFLSLRYLMSLDASSKDNKFKCSSYIKEINPIYRQNSKNKKKILMLFFLKSPFLYRIYRELQDPTLKHYKRQLKEKS